MNFADMTDDALLELYRFPIVRLDKEYSLALYGHKQADLWHCGCWAVKNNICNKCKKETPDNIKLMAGMVLM